MFVPIKLSGAGIVLRSPVEADFPHIRDLFNNSHTMKYLQEMTKPQGWTLEDVKERHFRRHTKELKGELIQLIVEDAVTGEFLGTSGLPTLDLKNKRAEQGLILLPQAWGKGVYTAVSWLTFHYAFETLGMLEMEFDTHPENISIIRFLEKIGAHLEEDRPKFLEINGQNIPRVIYTLSVRDWPSVKIKIHNMLEIKGRNREKK